MAVLKQRLHRKNSAGAYDIVHLETSADLVLMTDGVTKLSNKISSMDTAIAGKAASSHTHSNITGVLPVANGGTGVTSLSALKTALNIESTGGASGGNGSISGTQTVGNTITFDNLSWLVVDDGVYNSNECVLILTDVWCTGHWFDIERIVLYFWNYVLSPAARAKCTPHHFTEYNGNAYTIPCWVPTRTEVENGFSHFKTAGNRVAKYNNSNMSWWTSTESGSMYFNTYSVNSYSGAVDDAMIGSAQGIRLCVALKK